MKPIKLLLTTAGLITALLVHAQEESRNIIQFEISTSNNYVANASVPLQLIVLDGLPGYMAVSVDDPNYMEDANWQSFNSNLVVNLGTVDGWHEVWIGVKEGSSLYGQQYWQAKQLKLDRTPPLIVVTNPVVNTVDVPLIQVQGYSDENLDNITYDLSNTVVIITNQSVSIHNRLYDTVHGEFTTNIFQAYDIVLTNGLNIVTFHATDEAGNMMTTNISITLDYSSKTNPPNVQLFWPPNGEQISSDSFTWRGWVDDPAATVSAQIDSIILRTNINAIINTKGDVIVSTNVSMNEITNVFHGLVERNGNFWIENLPTPNVTNNVTLTVIDSAGNTSTTNIIVSRSPVTVTMNPITPASQLWHKTVTMTGTVSDPTYSVWINGVRATVYTDGTWRANNVPVTSGGTAVFDIKAYAP